MNAAPSPLAMTLLYIFPHPDDECFGPAPAMARQVREGHDVHLLTLTKGGATKQRHRLDLSVEEMGEVREKELAAAADELGVQLTVLDYPDSGLVDMDPRDLENVIERKITAVKPDIVVTYAVHGNSVHPDHLTTHAVVKRAYCQTHDDLAARGPKRLALFTLVQGEMEGAESHLHGSPPEAIGARVTFEPEDMEAAQRAIACYETYAEVVAEHRPLALVEDGVAFVLFNETHETVLDTITDHFESRG